MPARTTESSACWPFDLGEPATTRQRKAPAHENSTTFITRRAKDIVGCVASDRVFLAAGASRRPHVYPAPLCWY